MKISKKNAILKLTIAGIIIPVFISYAAVLAPDQYIPYGSQPASIRIDHSQADFISGAPQFDSVFIQGLANFYEGIYNPASGLFLDTRGSDMSATGSLGFSIAAVTVMVQKGLLPEAWIGRLAQMAENILFIQENQPEGEWLKILRRGDSVIALKILTDTSGAVYRDVSRKIAELNGDASLSSEERMAALADYISGIDFIELAKGYGFDIEAEGISVNNISRVDVGLLFSQGAGGIIEWAVSGSDIAAVMAYGYDGWLSHYLTEDLTRKDAGTEFSSVDTALLLAGFLYFAAAHGDYSYIGRDGQSHTVYEQVDRILMNVDMDSPQFYNEETNNFPHGWSPYAGGLRNDYWGHELLILHIVRALQNPGQGITLPDEIWKHRGSYIPSPLQFGNFLPFQNSIWINAYAAAFFNLHDYSIGGVDWWRNSGYNILDIHAQLMANGNTVRGRIGYYPYDAWLSAHEVFFPPGAAGYQMHQSTEFPEFSENSKDRAVNDGTFSPYGAITALNWLPFQAERSLNYHLVRSPELTQEGRNEDGFADATNRDPVNRQRLAYTSITYSLNTGSSYMVYADAQDGIVTRTMMQHPRVSELFSASGFSRIDIPDIYEFSAGLSSRYTAALSQIGVVNQNIAIFGQGPNPSAVVGALDGLRGLFDRAETIADYDDIIAAITAAPDNNLKAYLLAEAYVAKAHFLAGVVVSYPDQRAREAWGVYREQREALYSSARYLLDSISAQGLEPYILALRFCIHKNNFMVDEQVADFEALQSIWPGIKSSSSGLMVIDTVKRYDYEATLMGATYSYQRVDAGGGQEDWRIRVESTLYDWYGQGRRFGEPLSVRKALEGDVIHSRVYMYTEPDIEED